MSLFDTLTFHPGDLGRRLGPQAGHHRVGVGPAGALAITAHVGLLVGDAQRSEIDAADAVTKGVKPEALRAKLAAE